MFVLFEHIQIPRIISIENDHHRNAGHPGNVDQPCAHSTEFGQDDIHIFIDQPVRNGRVLINGKVGVEQLSLAANGLLKVQLIRKQVFHFGRVKWRRPTMERHHMEWQIPEMAADEGLRVLVVILIERGHDTLPLPFLQFEILQVFLIVFAPIPFLRPVQKPFPEIVDGPVERQGCCAERSFKGADSPIENSFPDDRHKRMPNCI